jgi:acyl-homoserine lactone synthase
MLAIHVVRSSNSHLYAEQLDQYFRARHDVYVKERGWTELDRPDGREIDQFDTPSAVYLMAIDGERVVGGHRLVPTSEPTLISDVFPFLALRGLPRRPDVCELSRIFVVRERRGAPSGGVESHILAGTMEYALAEEISQFTIVMETWWIPRLQEIGWNVKPLGIPVDIKGMLTVGVVVDVTEEAWEETRHRRDVPGSVLIWNGVDPSSRPIRRINAA